MHAYKRELVAEALIDLSRREFSKSVAELIEKDLRFWAQIVINGPNECWPHRFPLKSGYAFVYKLGRNVYAHRYAYELANGPIPILPGTEGTHHGTVVMHKCDNPPCCNPVHLKPGTQTENNKERAIKNAVRKHQSALKRAEAAMFLALGSYGANQETLGY